MLHIITSIVVLTALQVRLDPWGDNSVRVRIAPPGGSIQDPIISALAASAPEKKTVHRYVSEGELVNGNIKISIDSDGNTIVSRLSDGKTLLQGAPTFGQAFNGSHHGSVSAQMKFSGYTQKIYGLGEHSTGLVNQFPYSKVFADSLYYAKSRGGDVSIPWFASDHGYGMVWNAPSLGNVTISEQETTWVSHATKNVDFWVTTTPGNPVSTTDHSYYADLLNQYVDAVGHALPMPYWTTGFIQCKDRYRNQTQLLSVAREYVERGLPISMIVIDWFHWEQMGDFGLKEQCWPDPQAMVDELKGMGIELMITLWPFMGQNVSRNWQEYLDKKYLATSTKDGYPDSIWKYNTPTGNSLIDSSNPQTMNTTFNKWMSGYGKYGVRAIWMDESEPDHVEYISGGQWELFAGSDTEILPAWVKYWSDGFRRGFEQIGAKPGEFFILSRNAWSGTWANGAALWSGDISSNWDDFKKAVTISQGVAMSGIPLWTTDIGGYSGGDPSSSDFRQLVVRWFQFGAFCPLFRLHGHRTGGPPKSDVCGATNGDNEIWNLAPQQDHYNAIVAVMRLREDLRDYVKRLNDESVATGMPMLRPMFLEFPTETQCESEDVSMQYMFGADWLIHPVTESNATSARVYLPKLNGAEWVYWWSQDVVQSGWFNQTIKTISDFPLYFRRPT